MRNLLNIGIKQETIDKMIEKNGEIIISNLDHNYKNVYKMINIMSIFKIEDINNLLINYTPIFTVDYENAINALSKTNKQTIEEINEDPAILFEILNIA